MSHVIDEMRKERDSLKVENSRMRELLLSFKRNLENVLEEERTGFEVAHLREIEAFLADPA